MFTRAFWRATLERSLSTAAQAALLAVGADQINALHADWQMIGGFAAGGFALALLKAIATAAVTDGGPSIGNAERLD